jgi:hypothetical protein
MLKMLFISLTIIGCSRPRYCFEEHAIVRILGCNNQFCEAVFDDGYIGIIENNNSKIGTKLCFVWKEGIKV